MKKEIGTERVFENMLNDKKPVAGKKKKIKNLDDLKAVAKEKLAKKDV